MPIVAPRRMTNNDVSNTPELSGGGGGPQLVPSRISVVLVEETNAGTLQDGSVHVMIKRIGYWLA